MAKIGDLTVDEARNILCHVCERLRVSDIQELASGVGAVGKVLRLVPQMQQFITKVDELVQKYDGKVSPQTNGKHDGGEPGKAGKKLPELLHVLTRWGDTNGDRERLSEFHRQVHQMLGIVKGEHSEERCVAQLREYLKSPPPLRPQAQAPVLPVDKSFEHMIVHFCNLFDVGSLKDVYPRLNELCLFWRTTNVGLARLQYAIGEKSLVTPEQILSTAAEIIESIAHVDEDRNEDTNVLRNARDTTMEAVDLPENLPSGERGAFKDYHIDERLYEARDVEINPPVRRPSMDPPESLYSRKQSDSLYTADRKSMPSSMWDPDQTTRLTSILERNKLDFGESILEAYENAPSVAITGAPSLEQSPDRIGPKQGTREPMYAFGGELRPLQQATAVGSGASRNASWERSESVAATAPTEIMPPDEKQKSSESRWVYPMPLVYHGPSSKTPTSERDDGWVPTVDPPMLAGNWDASSASATGPWSVTNVVRVKLPKQPLGSGLSAFGFDGPRDLDYTKERTLQTQENRTGKGNSKLRNEAPQSDADELMAEATVKLHHDQGSPASRNEDEALGLDERLATIDAATHEADELDEESMKEESLSRLRWYQPRRKRGGSSSRTSGTD
ncbi:hypothetical protein BJ742DRAFT_230856 [Cladochytrium replicatum]|nr:hypothetical protein BJ742DRAFT_230856 [Cladochytrium replicatum]